MRQPTAAIRTLPAVLISLAGLCSGGCSLWSGSSGSGGAGPAKTISPAEFSTAAAPQSPDAAPDSAPVETPPAPAAQSRALATISPVQASDGIRDVLVVEGAPMAPPPVIAPSPAVAGAATAPVNAPSDASARTLVVEQSVGQINGRPVYASDFLSDMDGRLRANVTKMKRTEWVKETFKLVGDKLRDEIRDELLLSEFNTTIKPEQKPGVAAFFTKVQEDIRSGSLGSETLANKRLLEAEGKTVEEKAADVRDKALIQDQLRRQVYSRVQVTQREVRRYYDNNPAEFREPGVGLFRIIQVPKNDAARIARVEQSLAAGEAFMDIATRESDWNKNAKEGRYTLEVKFNGPLSEAQVFGPDALNDAAQKMTPKSRTEKLETPSSVWWLYLDTLNEPRTIPFYDAQLGIEKKIRNERYREEETKYFNSILKRSSASGIEEMALRITEFADQRYWGEGRVSQPAVAPPVPETGL